MDRKYTAVLDDDTLDAFEQLTRVARRRLGRHVDKVEIFSTLVLLAADDVSLRDQLISAVATATPTADTSSLTPTPRRPSPPPIVARYVTRPRPRLQDHLHRPMHQ
ncbi:hypothetical protein [Pseudonocardia sp. Ae707_Ps1]|uniref:hypothetical protein n=1 Tax=Pseudonocardia sp. Ae707_Ps1 TaxID=1885572 RepID=UPI00096318D2|nr:hypothetical protein [Pseudonocardia sp. Ae707_Ps1]OLM08727.1 hypothetical protein Ae707Ps1_6240c [Pseudonocardia sp. Ae707_Ps1]